MVNFCPKCGNKTDYQDALFCPNCGFKFKQEGKIEKSVLEEQPVTSKIDEYEEPIRTVSLKDLGNKLEEVVEKILRAKGYQTNRNEFVTTKSGLKREIDIVAKRKVHNNELVMAVECKNYTNPVPLKDMVYFAELLVDMGYKIGLFATSSTYTEQAKKRAEIGGIQTWDIEDLQEKYLLASIGRLQTKSKEYFKYALPEKISYEDAIKVDMINSELVTVLSADLIWVPFNKITYSFRSHCRTPDKEVHKFSDKGYCIIDAVDGELLELSSTISSPSASLIRAGRLLKKMLSGVSSKEALYINELKSPPQRDYQYLKSGNYSVMKLPPNVTKREVIKKALTAIIDRNTMEIDYEVKQRGRRSESDFDDEYETKTYTFVPKARDIILESIHLIYVPKWEVGFSSGEHTYEREMLAFSGKFIYDSISICPKHILKDILRTSKKKTLAVCEVCGNALCESHIFQCSVCKKWLCEEHSAICMNCKRHFCKEHIQKFCDVCNTSLCNECQTKCPICNKDFCEKHMVVCEICNNRVCINCVSTSRKKLIFKKYICKNCENYK